MAHLKTASFERNPMYERFTDRARKVMALANQEAQRFNHEYIGTEHILLGLVKEGSGVAANVLKNLGIDLNKVRLEVEKIVQAAPDMVTMAKLPLTPRGKRVIELATEASRKLNHRYVGTEHLLLGLIREQEGVASQILMNLGLKTESVEKETLDLLGHGPDMPEDAKEKLLGVWRVASRIDSLEAMLTATRLPKPERETSYLSGPMSGLPDSNFPQFDRYAKALRELGFSVINPAENFGGRTDLPREEYLRKDFSQILSLPKGNGRVFFMPGWKGSKGASLEYLIAKAVGIACHEVVVEEFGVCFKSLSQEVQLIVVTEALAKELFNKAS